MFKVEEEKSMDDLEKEEEIIKSYDDETEDAITEVFIEENEDNKISNKNNNYKKANLIINIIFSIIVIILLLSILDVYLVVNHNVGPFLAIPTSPYKDGGTREYYGLGYKVIKYHQLQGRRDTVVGSWSLKYDDTPVTIQDIDLSINMTDNKNKIYNKYYKKFVRIISTLKSVDAKKHTLTLGYTDEDGKYSLDIICKINKDQDNLEEFEENKETTIIGTISKFKEKTNKDNNRVYVSDCFAQQ